MPTQAEAARQAQEDAMARQAMMQASAQRQQAEAISRAQRMGDARSANELAIAQMQIGASKDIEASRATREEKANQALMDRQLALVTAGKGMSEAERAMLDMKRNDPDYIMNQRLAAKMGGGVAEPGGAKAAPPRSPAATDVSGAAPATPYDMTGFNSDVAGIADNVRVARNQSPGQLSYDDLPAYSPDKQGAFVRDPTGTMRQVHFPEASSSKTPNRAAIEQVKSSMMPKPPAGMPASGATKVMAPAQSPVAAPAADPGDAIFAQLIESKYGPSYETQRARAKTAGAEASTASQAQSILDGLAAKSALSPKESKQWSDTAAQFSQATGAPVMRQAPKQAAPQEFVATELADFAKKADELAGGSFGYASDEDKAAMRQKAQSIKAAMGAAGYSGDDIQRVVALMEEALKKTEGGLLIKQGFTEPARTGILAEY